MEMDGLSSESHKQIRSIRKAVESVKTGNVRLTLRRMFETAIGDRT